MKIQFTKFASLLLCSASLASGAFAAETSSVDHKVYFGVEGGYSVPAKHKFKDKDADGNKVIGKLKGTTMYEGKLGYRFYPNMSIELAYAYRPKYKLGVFFPDQLKVKELNGADITNITSKVDVASHTMMLNLMYEAQSEKAYRPYFLFGVGYAHVTTKKSPINGDIPTPVAQGIAQQTGGAPDTRPQIGNIKKFTSERLGWRVGTGIIYDLNHNVSLVGGVKLEVINNIGLHAEFLHPLTKDVVKKSALKKTIGVVDFTLGARISL